MIRTEAQNFLRTYTDRILASQERRRNRTEMPLWMDNYDAAAACNQKRSDDWDQLDYIQQVFGELTELLLQGIEKNKKLYLVPILEHMQMLYVELEHHSAAKLAIQNGMLDMVDGFHQCSGITARQVYQIVIASTITLPGDTFQLNRQRYYLSIRLNESVKDEGTLEWFWPLKYQIPLRPQAYRIPPLRRPEKILVSGEHTQTPLSAVDAPTKLLDLQSRNIELCWVLKPNQ